jgi:hypothetical protein
VLGCWKAAREARLGSAQRATAGEQRAKGSKKVKQDGQEEQDSQVLDARLPSTGVKRAKRTKKANYMVTLVTYVTLWTLWRNGMHGHCGWGVLGLPDSAWTRPSGSWKAAKRGFGRLPEDRTGA